jgi:anti-sigma factor RsiW
MSQPIGQHDPAQDLTAFADGELNAARRAVVLEYLADHPEAARQLGRELRFRQSVAQNLEAATPPVSDSLRNKIDSLCAQTQIDDRAQSAPRSRWKISLLPASIAAVICIIAGILFGMMMFKPAEKGGPPFPTATIAAITHIHVDCSRAPSLHNLPFPHQLGELQNSLKTYLGRSEPYPDLSGIGYQYVGAGPCAKPLEGTAHLLYKSIRGPITDTLSLFVQEYHGQIQVEDGKVYWGQGPDSAHPMIIWRKGNLVFYLVGDAPSSVEAAAGVMDIHPPA